MKKLVILIALLMVFIIGCGSQTSASQEERFKKVSYDNYGMYSIAIIQDKKTGCQYIYSTGNGTSIYPLLDSDGQPTCGK